MLFDIWAVFLNNFIFKRSFCNQILTFFNNYKPSLQSFLLGVFLLCDIVSSLLGCPHSLPPLVAASNMTFLSATQMCAQEILTLYFWMCAYIQASFNTSMGFPLCKFQILSFFVFYPCYCCLTFVGLNHFSATYLMVHFYTRPNLYWERPGRGLCVNLPVGRTVLPRRDTLPYNVPWPLYLSLPSASLPILLRASAYSIILV